MFRRTHDDPTLKDLIDVSLHACLTSDLHTKPGGPGATLHRELAPNAAGEYELGEEDNFWIRISVKKRLHRGAFVGVLACSNDGNIQVLWPAPNDLQRLGLVSEDPDQPGQPGEKLSDEQIRYVGVHGEEGETAICATVRSDQTVSAYTLKVVAYDDTAESGKSSRERSPVNLRGLAIQETVQEVLHAALRRSQGRRGDMGARRGGAVDSKVPRWATWHLPLQIRRSG